MYKPLEAKKDAILQKSGGVKNRRGTFLFYCL